MAKWLLRLKGDRFDLEDLPNLFRLPEAKVVEEKGSFYLESSKLNSLTSADEVREQGKALIKLINPIAKLHRNNFLDVSEGGVIQVDDDGKRHIYVFLKESLTLRSKATAVLSVIASNGSEKVSTQPNSTESLLKATLKHNEIAEAINFYADGTWISLYKAYEIIMGDVGKEQIKGWVSNHDINRFTQTAQSRDAIGDAARHASKKYKPPAKPMTLSEAKRLIRTMLLQWANSKSGRK